MRLSKKSTLVFISACTAGIVACSSDDSSSPSKVAISSSLAAGSDQNTANCNLANANWPQIGDPQNGTYANGDSFDGTTLSVTCTVKPSGDGTAFNVDATASIGGLSSFHVFGTLTTSGDQKGLQAEWSEHNTGKFASDAPCTTTYPSILHFPDNPPVAAGRVWATIDCPSARFDGNRACHGNATFRFENCTQQ